MTRLRDKGGKEIALAPVRPNAGIRATYRRRLLGLVDEMADSYEYWIRAAYRKNEPAIIQATDAIPAKQLDRAMKKLARQWEKRFDEAADELAAYFAKAAANRSDAALRSILKRGGFSVKFRMTRAMKDAVAAIVAENVSLIRSIPQEYATAVEGLVMRSVTAGRDLSTLSTELQARYGVSKRRAETIARDQNNKSSAALQRVRYVELGIKRAIWLHSRGGKKPRPTHVKNSGKTYDVAEGWFDPAVQRYIWPGSEINCRCVAKPIIRGFS